MENFTKENLRELRTKMNEMFKAFEAETGVKLEMGTIRFEAASFSSKLTATLPALKKNTLTLVSSDNLQSWDPNYYIGKKFIFKGKLYTVIQFQSSRPKFPYIFISEGGSRFKGTTTMIKDLVAEYDKK